MAKYTIISLILIDFVPIFLIFNLFQIIFRGSFHFKQKKLFKKSPNYIRGEGVISTLDPVFSVFNFCVKNTSSSVLTGQMVIFNLKQRDQADLEIVLGLNCILTFVPKSLTDLIADWFFLSIYLI